MWHRLGIDIVYHVEAGLQKLEPLDLKHIFKKFGKSFRNNKREPEGGKGPVIVWHGSMN